MSLTDLGVLVDTIMAMRHLGALDVSAWASRIVYLATGDAAKRRAAAKKDPVAVRLGRLGGLKGGKARAAKLSAERRSEIGRKGAEVMYGKPGDFSEWAWQMVNLAARDEVEASASDESDL